MNTLQIRCIKDGYQITKGNIYEIRTYHNSAQGELNYETSVYIKDDKGNKRHYKTEFFIDANDKQTWREMQLKELLKI